MNRCIMLGMEVKSILMVGEGDKWPGSRMVLAHRQRDDLSRQEFAETHIYHKILGPEQRKSDHKVHPKNRPTKYDLSRLVQRNVYK